MESILHFLLSRERFTIDNEKNMQNQVDAVLTAAGLHFSREVRLDHGNIIDFMVGAIGIEIKIKGNKRAIYSQLCRYAECDQVDYLILLTTVSVGLPAKINNKPVKIINISRAWL